MKGQREESMKGKGMKDKALILFTRIPKLGRIKTRLEPFLGKEQCVKLQTAFIKDIYDKLKDKDMDIIISYTEEGDLDVLRGIAGSDARLIKQVGPDIGDKMRNAIKKVLSEYKRVVLIGSDIPLLEKSDIETAFQVLETRDMVISPTYDGGYYLIGMKKDHPEVFGIQYSTSSVFEETVERIRMLGKSYQRGSLQLDIDDKEDFLKLHRILKDDRDIECRETRRVVNQIMEMKAESE